MILKQQYIKMLINDRPLRMRLAAAINVDPQTIDRRLGLRKGTQLNEKKLSTPNTIKFLSDEWGIDQMKLTKVA